jgi:type VI protein secretion system component Hcp
VVAPIDHNSGATTGKRQYSPVVIVREVDKASPKLMTNLGTIVIDASGETLSGTVTGIAKNGGKSAMDDWMQ